MTTSGIAYGGAWTPMPRGWQEKLEQLWPDGGRLVLAFALSPDIGTCGDLLAGRYVDPARLDQDWLRWAKREQFVALKPALECL